MARIDNAIARCEQIEADKFDTAVFADLDAYRVAAKDAEVEYREALSELTIRTTRNHWGAVCASL